MTTSQSQKLIPKADWKWECPYLYFNFFGAFWSSQKNVKTWILHCIFKKWLWCGGRGGGRQIWWQKNVSEKAQVLVVVMCPNLNFVAALLPPPPSPALLKDTSMERSLCLYKTPPWTIHRITKRHLFLIYFSLNEAKTFFVLFLFYRFLMSGGV